MTDTKAIVVLAEAIMQCHNNADELKEIMLITLSRIITEQTKNIMMVALSPITETYNNLTERVINCFKPHNIY